MARHGPNQRVISATMAAGSASPATTTTVLSGRYHFRWNASMLAGVAACNTSTVPIGDRLASGWPVKNVARVVSITRDSGPWLRSRISASTIGTSVFTPSGVKIGSAIMPESSLNVSSIVSGVAAGRSSL